LRAALALGTPSRRPIGACNGLDHWHGFGEVQFKTTKACGRREQLFDEGRWQSPVALNFVARRDFFWHQLSGSARYQSTGPRA
jgi:hypothetical protein